MNRELSEVWQKNSPENQEIASEISGWYVPVGNMTGGLLDNMKVYAASFVAMIEIGLIIVFIAQCFNNSTVSMAMIICRFKGSTCYWQL
jgi:hypothetical protein